MFDTAIAAKGTTEDIREAGYVLPDGTMLDFSGQKSGCLDEDHRELGFPMAMVDFQDAGAVRLNAASGMVETRAMPTSAQLRVMRDVIIRNGGKGFMDLTDGRRRAAVDIDNAMRMGGIVRRFYRGEDVGGRSL